MSKPDTGPYTFRSAAVAVGIGLVGAVLIWLATPFNDLVFNSPYISDSYLPVAALFLMLLLVLVVNPLLRRRRTGRALSGRQLALVFGILLVASVIPGQGLMRVLPHAIAKIPRAVREDRALAEAYERANLPPSLFPEKLGFGRETPASDHFLQELPRGEPVPWRQWVPPLLSWGAFLLAGWLMSLGLALIVFPQWQRAERLPFPLLTVSQALVEEPEEGRSFAAIFRSRPFWVAVGLVFVLHLLAGLAVYYPASVPAIPLNFSLKTLFTEEPFVHAPWWIFQNRIYFIFIGAAFFMPNRTSFSIWFFALAYAVYEVAGKAYFPPYHDGRVADHRTGAMLAVTVFVLWLGRAQWRQAFAALFRRARTDEDRRDRTAAACFVAGCAGMFAWMLWLGVEWYWALFFVAFAFMAALLIARLVAETGMPYIRIDIGSSMTFLKALPVTWFQPVAIWFAHVVFGLFTAASRVSLATMGTHALGMDEKAGARQQSRLLWVFLAILCLGVPVAGWSTLQACYHYTTSLDGVNTPLSPGGTDFLDPAGTDMVRQKNILDRGGADPLVTPAYNKLGHIGFGAGLAAALSAACLYMPNWPLHPIGLLIVGSVYANLAWFSIFLGWLVKVLVVRYGGSRLYRQAKPFFIGLIAGEVFAAVFWFLVPALIIAAGGHTYYKVSVVPQ